MRVLIAVITLVAGLSWAREARAQAALSTKFADVIMEYVIPGKVYNLRTMRNLPYRVVNSGAGPADVAILVEIPQGDRLKQGYESIPDPSWVRAVPDKLHLEPGQTGIVDLILQAPDDPQYTGRNFQAHIVCRGAEPPPGEVTGLAFLTSLQSRLRFTVGGPGPEEVRRLQKKGIYQTLNFTLEPQAQHVPGFLEPGKKIDLVKESGAGVTVVNRGAQKLQFNLRSVRPPGEISPPAGYENAPDPDWLKISPEVLKVKAGAMASAKKIVLEIPDVPEHRGKRYMFVIQAQLSNRDIPVEVFSSIYVSTAK